MDKITLEELKNALGQEHDRLVAELKTVTQDQSGEIRGGLGARFPKFELTEYGSHSSLDEEADEVEEYETLLSTEQSFESRLLEIKRALTRMDRGEYGTCSRCGKPIALARLRANPAAEFDIEHSV